MRMPFPHREDLRLQNMSRISKQQVINLDVSHQKVIASDPNTKTITVRQYLPSGADLSLLADSLKAQTPELQAVLAKSHKKN